MAQNVKIEWNGDAVKAMVEAACEAEVDRAANVILKKAKAACPVESVGSARRRQKSKQADLYGIRRGALRDSGRIVKFKKDGVVGAYIKFGDEVTGGVDTFYARFVELGTPGTVFRKNIGYWGEKDCQRISVKSKPFLRTATKTSKNTFYRRIRKALPK